MSKNNAMALLAASAMYNLPFTFINKYYSQHTGRYNFNEIRKARMKNNRNKAQRRKY